MKHKYDVIIIGAGPSGSAAAIKIASGGHSVLLIDKFKFPRVKSCGGGLTRTSIKYLLELGLGDNLKNFNKVNTVQLSVKNKGKRLFSYPDFIEDPNYRLVVNREELDYQLVCKAKSFGVHFLDNTAFKKLIFQDTKVVGVTLENSSKYYSDLVIGADGANSKVAKQANLKSVEQNNLGIGISAFYELPNHTIDKMNFYLPIQDQSNKKILPSYGWVFPVNKNTLNIGIGVIDKNSINNHIDTILNLFLDRLIKEHNTFKHLKIHSNILKGEMSFNFNPKQCYAPGIMLVGDAAGLTNPFVGEGISYALESGILAASAYQKLKNAPNPDFNNLSKYGDVLASKYQGYFEAGSSSINRFHLVWKVLKGTFNNDKPLFNAIRQATVFSDGINPTFFKHHSNDISGLLESNKAIIKTDILSISQNIIDLTRKDWPFISKIFSSGEITHGIPFRPSIFILLTGLSKQKNNRAELIQLGTAIELGLASTICHDSISEADEITDEVNWGNMMSILIGDYLLSKSFEIIAPLQHTYTRLISEYLEKTNEGILLMKEKVSEKNQITFQELMTLYYLKNSSMFELCLHLGYTAQKTPKKDIDAIRKFGKHYGVAYFLAEDASAYFNNNTDLNTLSLRQLEQQLIALLTHDKNSLTLLEQFKTQIKQEITYAKNALLGVSDTLTSKTLHNFCDILNKKLNSETHA